MVTTTTTYSFKKPTVADDEDVWGGYLNETIDLIDDVLDGTTPVTGIDINSGTIDNVVIGGATAAAGSFTSVTIEGSNVVFEGATADAFETTLTVTDPTADRTFTLPDATGTAAIIDVAGVLENESHTATLKLNSTNSGESRVELKTFQFGAFGFDLWDFEVDPSNTDNNTILNFKVDGETIAVMSGTDYSGEKTLAVTNLEVAGDIILEGSTADAFETTLTVTDPTADRTITLPDTTGTVAVYSADGTSGQVLTTNGSGVLSFADAGGGGGGATVEATASGALSNGDAVILNSDGTVSVVANTTETQSLGSTEVYESANSFYTAAVYDPNTQKVVIGYVDNGNSNQGTAVVGTVSGTSISFGTPVVFETGSPYYLSGIYDEREEKIVFCYRDTGNSNYGTAIVGTVSGTSISFGTAVVYNAGSSFFNTSVYDPSTGKVVIAYRDVGNSNYGTAVVGTVSGTSISFGTEVVFEQADTRNLTAVYEPNFQKIVICYEDVGNGSDGTAIVGTVSGDTITFGSPVVFETNAVDFVKAVYDENAKKIAIFYQDEGTSDKGTAIVGTVTNETISFGSSYIFNNASTSDISATYNVAAKSTTVTWQDGLSGEMELAVATVSGNSISVGSTVTVYSGSTDDHAAAYDSDTKAVVVAYRAIGNSFYGTGVVFRSAYTASNVTSSNFIGFADDAYSDAATATINVVGSVNEGQSGLTAGKAYYVQNDGSLEKYPDNPEVFAGIASAATKIIVKG